MTESRVAMDDIRARRRHIRSRLAEVNAGRVTLIQTEEVRVPKNAFDYIFTLQGIVEKEGAMDYRIFAQRMWSHLSGAEAVSTNEGFTFFERSLITGLHAINMNELVYPHVVDSMSQLIQQYGAVVGTVALWSTGDVTATGYQLGKIERSGIIRNFFDELKKQLPRNGRSSFVKEKTAYLVDDNKYDRLSEFVGERLEQHPDKFVKLVVIEDSINNIEKARRILAEKFGGEKVEVIPIWFTGSREGINAQKAIAQLKDGKDPKEYQKAKAALEKKKQELNAVDSFDELLQEDRFKDIFAGAHVMVDFDGVVGDNIRMRDEQASVTYNALLAGMALDSGMEIVEVDRKVGERLKIIQS